MAGRENGDAVGIYSHNRVYRFAAGYRVILAHPQPCAPPLVDYTVGVPECASFRALRRERLRFGRAESQRVEPLIREMGEVEDAIRYCPRSTTVLMNSGARIERRRKNIFSRALANNHAAARFLRTRFEPIYLATVEADFRESYRLGDNEVRSNGR
jgi:hypothetical protein